MSIKTSNSFFRLPFLFDPARLERDLQICLEIQWPDHFNRNDYSGEWTGIALRSATGETGTLYAHSASGYRDTPLLAACVYFREIAEAFLCEKETIRLLRLAPGSEVKEHRDPGAGYAFGSFRVHVPIRTSPGVSFVVDGSELPMKSGECWYADFDRPHSVTNRSGRDRIHLIMDCQRNDWSDELFRKAGYDFAEEKRRQEPDAVTKKRMIEELTRLDTDAARKLIRELTDGTPAS